MSRIAEVLTACRARGRAALVPYLTAGDPSLDLTPALVRAAVDAGADLIELGVPFSDPMADGPVLQRSAGRALGGRHVAAARARDGRPSCDAIARHADRALRVLQSLLPLRRRGAGARCRRSWRRRHPVRRPADRRGGRAARRGPGGGARPDRAAGADHAPGARAPHRAHRQRLPLLRLGPGGDGGPDGAAAGAAGPRAERSAR